MAPINKEAKIQGLVSSILRIGTKEPDYEKCFKVSTKASLKKMILPGLIVIITPLFLGIVFHPSLVAGLLPGSLISGVQLAISMSNNVFDDEQVDLGGQKAAR